MTYIVDVYIADEWRRGGSFNNEDDAIRCAWALHFANPMRRDVRVTQREEKIIFTASYNSQMYVRGRNGT